MPRRGMNNGAARRKMAERLDEIASHGLALLLFLVAVSFLPIAADVLSVKDALLAVGVPLLVGLSIIRAFLVGCLEWPVTSMNVGVLATLGWGLASIAWSQYRYLSVAEAGRLALYAGLYFVMLTSIRTPRSLLRVLHGVIAAAFVTGVYGLLQCFHVDPVPWSQHDILSTFGNDTYFASFIVLTLPVVGALFLCDCFQMERPPQASRPGEHSKESAPSRTLRHVWIGLYAAVIAVLFVCLIRTVSRAAVAGIVIGFGIAGILCWRRSRVRADTGQHRLPRRGLAIGAVLAVLAITLGCWSLPRYGRQKVTSTIGTKVFDVERGRLALWRSAVGMFRAHPVGGAGLGTYRVYIAEGTSSELYQLTESNSVLIPTHAHNEFLQVLAEQGVVGFGALLFLLVGFFRTNAGLVSEAEHRRTALLAAAWTAGVIAFTFQNLFAITFRVPATVVFFWCGLGLTGASAGWLTPEGAFRIRRRPLPRLGPPGLVGCALLIAAAVSLIGMLQTSRLAAEIDLHAARNQIKTGLCERAMVTLARVIERNPYSFEAYYDLGVLKGQAGDHEGARRALLSAAALNPNIADVHYNIGICYERLGRAAEALPHLEKAAQGMPIRQTYQALAGAYFAVERYQEALPYAQRAAELGTKGADKYASLMLVAKALLRLGRKDQALKVIQDGVPVYLPAWAEGAIMAGDILLAQGKYDLAEQAYNKALKSRPTQAEIYIGLAASDSKQGRHAQAVAVLENGRKCVPSSQLLALSLAREYDRAGNIPAAWKTLHEVIAMGPDTVYGRQAAEVVRRSQQVPKR